MVGVDEDINSIVAAKLLKQALGDQALVMVFEISNSSWTESVLGYCNQLGLNTYVLKRTLAYQSEISSFNFKTPLAQRLFYRRFINYHLLIQAEKMKVKVVDTADKSDRLLGLRPEGFYGHLMPFYSFYKSEISKLAEYLDIPNQFILQTNYQEHLYPGNIALAYEKIDPILFLLTEKQLTPEEISRQFKTDLNFLKRLKSHLEKALFQTPVSQFII